MGNHGSPDGALMVQWFFGGLVVVFYAVHRFNEPRQDPRPARSTTTFWRYWSACGGYVLAMLGLFIVLGGGLGSIDPRILMPLIDPSPVPADARSLPGPLLSALQTDPAVKLRRQITGVSVLVVVAATFTLAWQVVSRRRADAEREVGRQLDTARADVTAARAKLAEARKLRLQSFAVFDAMNYDEGDALWRQMRALLPAIDAGYDQAERGFETASALDRTRLDVRKDLSDVRFEHAVWAEEFGLGSKAQVLAERLASNEGDGAKRKLLAAPGTLALNASREIITRRDAFWNGVVLYREKRWAEAYSQFQNARGPEGEEDRPLQLYLRRLEPLALQLTNTPLDQ